MATLLDGGAIKCAAHGFGYAVCRRSDGARTDLARDWPEYAPDYSDAETLARREQRGIWEGPHIAPWEWRRGARQ